MLPESAPPIQPPELLPSRHQQAKQLEQPQQTQDPQKTQIQRHNGLQVKPQNGQQVDKGKGVANEGQARPMSAAKLRVFWRGVKPQKIFEGEDDHGKHIETVEPYPVGLVNLRH